MVFASTEFEIHFIEDGIRYQYGYTIKNSQILREWLYVYVGKKSQRWFEREMNDIETEYNWYFGSYFAGGNQRKVWRDATRRNALFHDPRVNKNKAQLIFSTHDTSLLDSDLFRRDQIWFMEKDSTNASRLYPLTDYSPRPSEALEKGYLQGRYGALPFFGEFKFNASSNRNFII